ncbi:Glycosidase [Pseudarcicella hirudinis]|uniref:Glycosidase n=1 Tax=Pseudarcicella hirudinis TaxID=1079859 RepID=A0A1I5UY39_9BACT|nr:alpha-amylase family protein [Pseudarcicella hirudinis]SFQ00151.1 Glycosidase [Pseudarcicella hirudinis]
MTKNTFKNIILFVALLLQQMIYAQLKSESPKGENLIKSHKKIANSFNDTSVTGEKVKKNGKVILKSGTSKKVSQIDSAIVNDSTEIFSDIVKVKPINPDKKRTPKVIPAVQKSEKKTRPKSMKLRNDKIVVYQMMFHLWGNKNTTNKMNGSAAENGVTKFSDINTKALSELKKFGYSHLYMTGLIEHATMEDLTAFGIPKDHPDVVKGRCGSPFAIKDYYDVNPFFAEKPENRMAEFEAMLARVHKAGLKLVMDFVPNHVARVYHSDMKPKGIKDFGVSDDTSVSFNAQNNFYYLPNTEFKIPDGVNSPVKADKPYSESPAKASGNDVFSAHPGIDDWFETVKLNYGVDIQDHRRTHFDPIPSTWLKMTQILEYWTKKGVDGFRCDMAEMVPVEFWAYAIPKTKKLNPNLVFIAEIYNPNEYHNYINVGKFDYLYDKVGLYDGLRRLVEQKPEATVEDITRVWQNESGDISEHMLRFLENHDEHRINTPSFAKGNPFAVIPAMVVTATLHTGPLMIYFGQEVGEKANDKEGFNQADDRTSMFDFWGVPAHQAWMNGGKFDGGLLTDEQKELRAFYGNLIKFTNSSEAIREGGFYDLQYVQDERYDRKKVYSYIRYSDNQKLLIICNFDFSKEQNLNIQIPEGAWNAMELNPKNKYTLKGVYDQKSRIVIESEKAIPVTLAPNSVKIFEISEKK